MDKLIRFSEDHRIISEMHAMYKEILGNINILDPSEYVSGLNKIFNETVLPHFEFEEKEIFPHILSKGDQGLQNVVLQLENEHKRIRDKLNTINKQKSELGASPSVKEKERLLSLCNELARELNEHALKEDTDIFPLLKESSINSPET